MSFNRYSKLISDGVVSQPPHISISERNTDIYVEYIKGMTRLDVLSYDYYDDPNYDWVILLANDDKAALEFEIPNHSIIRIPYPLSAVLEEYDEKLKTYDLLYGIE